MILKEFRNYFNQSLENLYPKTEIDTFFFLLVEAYLDFQRIDITLKPQFDISDKRHLFQKALERLEKEEPIQYILGKTEFYGYPFLITRDTLIPRPETEELVFWILETVNKNSLSNLKILDIGTGTGCIPISLKKEMPSISVSAIDISKNALEIAHQNANLNKVQIDFFQQDILETSSLDEKFDIIVSNPPYVRELEKKQIKNNVLQNEPHIALFVENKNPLLFYDKILELAKNSLHPNGFLFFEINQYLGKETVQLVKNKGFTSVELKKDLFGNDRILKIMNNLT